MMRSRSRSPTNTSSSRSPSRSPSRSYSRSRSPTSSSPCSPRDGHRRGGEEVRGDSGEGVEERGTRVHVGSLAISTSTRELHRHFRRFGHILDLWMARTQPCFAFVVFRHKEDALKAIRFMDGETVHNRRIRVTMARPRTKGTRSGGTFNPYLRCYQCGKMGHFSRVCRAHQWSSVREDNRPRREGKEKQEDKYYSKSQKTPRRNSSSDGATYRRF